MNDKDNYFLPFPRRLRLLFDETRASQADVAKYVGVSRQAVSHWINGKTTPDCYSFKKVAEFFKVPLEYLYGETDSKVRENILVAESLGLSDKAIENIMKLKEQPYQKEFVAEKKELYPTKSEIFSDIVTGIGFEQMIEYLQQAVIEYRFYEDTKRDVEVNEMVQVPDVFNAEADVKRELYSRGEAVISAEKMSIFCMYQTVDIFRKIVDYFPETYWIESMIEANEGG